jgi:hypothetical protein
MYRFLAAARLPRLSLRHILMALLLISTEK